MTFFCEDCKYINECKPRKNNPQAIGCCDFGLLDENGLIEDWDESGEESYTEEQIKLLTELNNFKNYVTDCEQGKSKEAMREKIYGDGYQDGHRDGYDKGYADAQALSKRPQGKWIIIGEEQGALNIIYKIRKCSNCGWEHSLLIPDNFCPKCGADMKGE